MTEITRESIKDRNGIIALLKSTLPEKRYAHTLSVEKEALYIASQLGTNTDGVWRAALLHDLTKPLSLEEHIALAKKLKAELSENDLKSPETVHAKTGGALVKSLGEDYFSAIENHTTGKVEMSVLEKIIFVADYTEETRAYSSCTLERALLHSELEKAETEKEKLAALNRSVYRILDSTVSHLLEKKVFIHPATIDALEYYRTLNSEE